MCNCVKESTEMLRAKVGAETTNVHTWKDKGGYDNATLLYDEGVTVIATPFSYEYIKKKKNGEPEKYTTIRKINMIGSFCPFCGQKREVKNIDEPKPIN